MDATDSYSKVFNKQQQMSKSNKFTDRDESVVVPRVGGWGEDREGKGSRVSGDGQRPDFWWWAHKRVYKCHITKSYTWNLYVISQCYSKKYSKNWLSKYLLNTYSLQISVTCNKGEGAERSWKQEQWEPPFSKDQKASSARELVRSGDSQAHSNFPNQWLLGWSQWQVFNKAFRWF